MFCPQCGSTQPDELNFCKSCGANLGAIRDALDSGFAPNKFDWSKTWVAEMFQSSEQAVKKERELERLKGITPEVKRRNEIKAGVITASVGVAIMVFLRFLMEGIILGGNVPPGDAEILSRVWLAGFIPFMVGIALIINGTFVSRMFSGSDSSQIASKRTGALNQAGADQYLPPADTNELFPAGFSVTDETTQHLKESIKRK
jgi:hypothetical protein